MKTKIYYSVEFLSPGTFFSESSCQEFAKLDYKAICDAAKTIKERYGAMPYGFKWTKYEVPIDIPKIEGYKVMIDPNVLDKSPGTIFITGEVIFSNNLNGPDDKILKSNLESNNGGVGIINTNSYKFHAGFNEDDIVIGWDGAEVVRGDIKPLMEYRKKIRAKKEAEYAKYK